MTMVYRDNKEGQRPKPLISKFLGACQEQPLPTKLYTRIPEELTPLSV